MEKHPDINAQGREYGSALQVASAGGHMVVVWLLLENNADINAVATCVLVMVCSTMSM